MGDTKTPLFDAVFRDQLSCLIRWRRDVRRFLPDPVPEEVLGHLLDLACLAPSVGCSQPWRFVTVDAPERRAEVRANFERCNAEALGSYTGEQRSAYARLKLEGLDQAPCHIALFVDPDPVQGHGLGRRTMPETTSFSAVMAAHTLWLAARAYGLGLGWVSILDPDGISATLQLPQSWTFVGYLCLGYPEVESTTPELERVGWEKRRGADRVRLRR